MESPSFHELVTALKRLPVRRTVNDVWEVGIVLIAHHHPDGEADPSDSLAMAACVTESGIGATSIPMPPESMPAAYAIDAVARLAFDRSTSNGEPLGYLPARILIRNFPEPLLGTFRRAMRQLGVIVESKTELQNLAAFVNDLIDELQELDMEVEPLEARGLLHARGMTVERIGAFAEAAEMFWNAAPWRHFDDEVCWTIEPKPRTRALRTCIVMGGGGREFGLAFLSSVMEYFGLQLRSRLGVEPGMPRTTMWSMTYYDISEAPEEDQLVWEFEKLPLAALGAFPVPVGFTPGGNAKRPTTEQLNLFEALLRGFADVTRAQIDSRHLRFNVNTFDGPTSLYLSGTCPPPKTRQR